MKSRAPNHILFNRIIISLFLLLPLYVCAQMNIKGQVTDENMQPIEGATVAVFGTSHGTFTDANGQFELEIDTTGKILLVFRYIGYTEEKVEISSSVSDLSIVMRPLHFLLEGPTIYGYSKLRESWAKAAGTIEIMDLTAIRSASASDFYDDIADLKGIQTYKSSLNFSSYNFRGFGAIANERFVQLVDGMDNSAPLLNFPTGNIVGISDLDVKSVELIPGAASALYGPNAFNGILIMTSKNPFDYQGLSVDAKTGVTASDAGGSHPYYQLTARYAKALNKHLAFKLNASWIQGTDWVANDYSTGRRTLTNPDPSGPGAPDFDGLNTYGDETQIVVPMAVVSGDLASLIGEQIGIDSSTLEPIIRQMPSLDIRRTGFREEDLLESNGVNSLKLDGALHYRITDDLEASYTYRFGSGSTVYQGGERYVLRDFTQQYHKLELQSP